MKEPIILLDETAIHLSHVVSWWMRSVSSEWRCKHYLAFQAKIAFVWENYSTRVGPIIGKALDHVFIECRSLSKIINAHFLEDALNNCSGFKEMPLRKAFPLSIARIRSDDVQHLNDVFVSSQIFWTAWLWFIFGWSTFRLASIALL